MDVKKDFHAAFAALKEEAIRELKNCLYDVGNEYMFGDDSCAIVCAYVYDHPSDFKVTSMFVDKFGDVYLNGHDVECFDEQQISINDVEGEHIPYLWDEIFVNEQ